MIKDAAQGTIDAASIGGGGEIVVTGGDVKEDLTSQITGSAVVFLTAHNYTAGSTEVFLNGLQLYKGVGNDYIESGRNTITLSNPPKITNTLTINYLQA